MTRHSKREVLNHILFWQWEYERRHPDFKPRVRYEQVEGVTPWTFQAVEAEYGGGYDSSDEIIEAIIKGTFVPKYPGHYFARPELEGFIRLRPRTPIIQENASAYRKRYYNYTDGGGDFLEHCDEFIDFLEGLSQSSGHSGIYSVNLDMPIEILTEELKNLYDDYHADEEGIDPEATLEALLYRKHSPAAGKIIGSLGARAVGLWLWDQEQKGLTNKSANARALEAREGSQQLGQFNGIEKYASRLVAGAEYSIKNKTIGPVYNKANTCAPSSD